MPARPALGAAACSGARTGSGPGEGSGGIGRSCRPGRGTSQSSRPASVLAAGSQRLELLAPSAMAVAIAPRPPWRCSDGTPSPVSIRSSADDPRLATIRRPGLGAASSGLSAGPARPAGLGLRRRAASSAQPAPPTSRRSPLPPPPLRSPAGDPQGLGRVLGGPIATASTDSGLARGIAPPMRSLQTLVHSGRGKPAGGDNGPLPRVAEKELDMRPDDVETVTRGLISSTSVAFGSSTLASLEGADLCDGHWLLPRAVDLLPLLGAPPTATDKFGEAQLEADASCDPECASSRTDDETERPTSGRNWTMSRRGHPWVSFES